MESFLTILRRLLQSRPSTKHRKHSQASGRPPQRICWKRAFIETGKLLIFNLVVRMAMSRVCLRPILSERIPNSMLPIARPSMKLEVVMGTQI